MSNLNDQSLMPWGKHKGKPMEDVPASYLLFCYNNGKCCDNVRKYIEENMDVLQLEINENDHSKRN